MTTHSSRSISVLVLVMVSACQSSPNPIPYHLPDEEGASIETSTVGDVEAFGQHCSSLLAPSLTPPDPAQQSRVTLDELLSYAVTNAPDFLIAAASLLEGEAARIEAEQLSPFNPYVRVAAGGRSVGGSTFFAMQLQLSQPIEIAGERDLRIEHAERLQELLSSRADELCWALHLQVHNAYLDALVAREHVAFAESLVDSATQIHDYVALRVKAGEEPEMTLVLLEADTAQAKKELVLARQAYESARLDMARYSGWPLDMPPEPVDALEDVHSPPDVEALIELALEHHPAFRSDQLAVNEAKAELELIEAEVWPELVLGFQYGLEDGSTAVENIWLFSMGFTLPVWNQGKGTIARAQVNTMKLNAAQKAHRIWLEGNIRRAHANLSSAEELVQLYGNDILPTLEINLSKIQKAYELGEFDIVEVALTRQKILSSEQDALKALKTYFQAHAELEALLGAEF